ncbi:hypothetical protein AMJ49_02835 [Parcubacteria bacterium DG_74_2]|nr:MAG: hypothetical protein AMJ49_02835 [Parcubacteria bacterium DG_74_2]
MALDFYFNLRETAIFQALVWSKIFGIFSFLKKIFLILFFVSFILFTFRFLKSEFFLVSLSLFFIFWYLEAFFNSKIKKPHLFLTEATLEKAIAEPQNYNLAEFLDFELARAVFNSIKFAKKKGLPEVSSTVLLYNLISENRKLNFIFSRILLDMSDIKEILEKYFEGVGKKKFERIFSKDFKETILESLKIIKERGKKTIEIGDVLIALAKKDLIFKKILIDSKLKIQDIENLVFWLEDLEKIIEKRKRFWDLENLLHFGSLGKEWAAAYTITLDRFSIDITELVKKQRFPEIIGHKREIEAMERILSSPELNDALIVGEAGSGRKSMIYALAEKSCLGQCLPELNYKRVLMLDIPSLLAQTESLEKEEAVLDTIFNEVITARNVILIIDEFHNYVGPRRPGTIDISGILSSYLSSPLFKLVAITTFEGLHKSIELNPTILSFLGKIEVSEISERETMMLLEDLALRLEGKYKLFISYPALRDIVTFASKYLPAIPFPEKAMKLLEEIVVHVFQARGKMVLPEHVAKIVTEKTEIPVGEIEIKEKAILLNLENIIHQRIINQEEAVKEVSAALRRARAEISLRKGPIGSFLFLGPTGVGKTETSKVLAEVYFGAEERMIRLDMSEFQNITDISRLLGAPGQEGLLTTPVRENPFSLILLDEFEKAHSDILNLFLQVFDEGRLTDGLGRKVDFKNTIIISTSNAGYQIILEALKKKTEWSEIKEKLLDFIFEKGIFRPELINRFDAVVVFKPLTKENLLDIAELLLKKMVKNLREKEIKLVITQSLKEKIVELSYSPQFGARQMQRIIQDKVGNPLAYAFLSGKIKRGDMVEVDPENFEIIKK